MLPVNHLMDGTDVVFRTAFGSKLAAAQGQNVASFEADHYDQRTRSGWCVLVSGRAELVETEADVSRLSRRGLHPWASAAQRQFWIRIRPTSVTGRQTSASR
jgi:nitroimidazol reductase NimA-like FMN-containing flavoprotein (pyridoxamine 5'-phosphate oxidase superfamily)